MNTGQERQEAIRKAGRVAARVLLLATTTGYQTRSFGEAAERLGVKLVFATDRCDTLDDPWQDQAIPIRFHDESASVEAILAAARTTPFDGVLVVGDRPTVIGALVAEALGMPGHPSGAVAAARNKRLTRERLHACGLPVPRFVAVSIDAELSGLLPRLSFPCVVKPVALAGSRGVMRANDVEELNQAFERLRKLLKSRDILAERSDAHHTALIEAFIPGREFALEGLLHHGVLHVLAIFDKPDPLDGPFFEETLYITPSSVSDETARSIERSVARAADALGLRHGPIHAECRANADGVFVIEVAARPIGGLCSRALRFVKRGRESFPDEPSISLEELLIRHSLGESPEKWGRESTSSGVMMIPIPARGIYRRVSGEDEAREVAGIVDIRITAKADQLLIPLPEGASYLGFIFARGGTPDFVDRALRMAHDQLHFTVDPALPVLQSRHG